MKQQLFRRSDVDLSESDHHLHIVKRNGLIASLPSNIESRPEFRYGYPGPVVDINAAEAFVSAYDRRTRNAHWSAEYLTMENLKPGTPPPSSGTGYLEDLTIPESLRARLSAYTNTGYDRGQLAPSADAQRSQKALDDTYVLSNIAPQVGIGFSRDYWAFFEVFVRGLTREFDHVYVITGPLYIPTVEPSNGKATVTYEVLYSAEPNTAPISVPTHFHKTILAIKDGTDSLAITALGSFIIPNKVIERNTPLKEFYVANVKKVESYVGVVFFDKVNKDDVRSLCDLTDCKL
ncbi:nuclease [Entomortierella beljakovae]|nr:nuclease [Entomortierella beljakovae]